MKYLTIGKYRGDDFPDYPFVISTELDSKKRAVDILSSLTESFYNLKIVEIIAEFKDVNSVKAAAGQGESPVNVAQQSKAGSEDSAQICPSCKGTGNNGWINIFGITSKCQVCNGTGKLLPC